MPPKKRFRIAIYTRRRKGLSMVFPGGERPQNLLPFKGFCVRSDPDPRQKLTPPREGGLMSKNTGIVKDRRFLGHGGGFAHPENPQRLVSIYEMLENPDMA